MIYLGSTYSLTKNIEARKSIESFNPSVSLITVNRPQGAINEKNPLAPRYTKSNCIDLVKAVDKQVKYYAEYIILLPRFTLSSFRVRSGVQGHKEAWQSLFLRKSILYDTAKYGAWSLWWVYLNRVPENYWFWPYLKNWFWRFQSEKMKIINGKKI